MKSCLISFLAVVLLFTFVGCTKRRSTEPVSVTAAYEEIVIDGEFSDWDAVGIHYLEAATAANAAFAIESIRIAHDDAAIHLMFTLDENRNIQGLDGTLELLLDVDGDGGTGVEHKRMKGVDAVVQFTPPNRQNPEERGMGVGVVPVGRVKSQSVEVEFVGHSDLGLALGPTYASKHIEISLRRGVELDGLPPFFLGTNFSAKLGLLSQDQTAAGESDVFEYSLSPIDTRRGAKQLANQLPVKAVGSLRVVSWNVEFGSILRKPDVYRRMLKQLEADVLLFQELSRTNTSGELSELLGSVQPNRDSKWEVILGGDEDDPIRCGIAARFPLKRVDEISFIPYPNRPDRFVRALGGEISMPNGKALLATSIHLKCCGRIGSTEDDTRTMEVELINAATRSYLRDNPTDGLVMGGDLNLVGSYQPVVSLAENLDRNEAALGVVRPYHLNGRSNATWENPDSQFAPGRLDFLLVSESSITAHTAFVFNTKDMSADALSLGELLRSDSREASDHYPIVVDLVWGEAAPQ